jgi:hypothetical protein
MTEFTLLSKFRDSNKHDETKAVDIVGVHSIRGPPSESWKAEDGSFWLNDLLPKDLKHARIFSFGFVHSDIISDPSKNFNYVVGILFNAIVDARSNVPSARPLILMCHGIGGLLVEGVSSCSLHKENPMTGELTSV